MSGMEKAGFGPFGRLDEDSSGAVSRSYKAPPNLAEYVGGAQLQIDLGCDAVRGRLALWRSATGMSERLRGIFSSPEKVRIEIDVPCSTLISLDGKPNSDAAEALIQRALAESMLIGEGERNTLLRASEVTPSSLLRPAPSVVVDEANLLHPAEHAD